jgi:demethylmenaquinone methyltransferase/2-methoxy-6-polyprenyl-1,4-benzoquinol methylase
MRVLGCGRHQVDRPEPARIDETEVPALVGLEHKMLVQCQAVGSRRAEHHPARHAEVQQHAHPAIEAHQDVFAAPAEGRHARPGHRRRQPGGKRPAHVGAVDCHMRQPPPQQPRRQAAHHRLDLGQFRHGWF